jgi:hypothetical protein
MFKSPDIVRFIFCADIYDPLEDNPFNNKHLDELHVVKVEFEIEFIVSPKLKI